MPDSSAKPVASGGVRQDSATGTALGCSTCEWGCCAMTRRRPALPPLPEESTVPVGEEDSPTMRRWSWVQSSPRTNNLPRSLQWEESTLEDLALSGSPLEQGMTAMQPSPRCSSENSEAGEGAGEEEEGGSFASSPPKRPRRKSHSEVAAGPPGVESAQQSAPVSLWHAMAMKLAHLHYNKAQVLVKTLSGRTVALKVPLSATVEEVKHLIWRREKIPSERQGLVYAGKQLEDDRQLKEYNIQRGSTLHGTPRLKGGDSANIDNYWAYYDPWPPTLGGEPWERGLRLCVAGSTTGERGNPESTRGGG